MIGFYNDLYRLSMYLILGAALFSTDDTAASPGFRCC